MTTVARRNPEDSAKIKAIEEKLLANPEMAKLIDELGTSTTDANDLVRGLLQASINRGLNAEMDAHLGYQHGDRDSKEAAGQNNSRNGSYPKRVDSNYGPVDVAVPRDRDGSFLPTMVPKGSRRLTDVDDMIISLYAGGMTVRDIQHHMATAMGVDISHETISAITDAVLEEVMIWQNRQLEEFYPVIFLDALRIKVRDGGRVVNKSAYLAIGVDMDFDQTHPRYLAGERGRSLVLGPGVRQPRYPRRTRCVYRVLRRAQGPAGGCGSHLAGFDGPDLCRPPDQGSKPVGGLWRS